MAIVLPQLAPASEDRVSGAQVIDSSLRFDHDLNQYLKFTPTSSGNRRTWTFSCWFKKMEETANRVIFSSYGSGATPWTAIQTTGNGDGRIQATFDAGISSGYYTDARYRNNGWYHLVWSVDTTQGGDPDKSKLYINGELQTYGANAHPSLNEETKFNLAGTTMYIGYTPNQLFDGYMSQCYFLDGLSVGSGYFGYTDPLTGTWRPKKFKNSGTTVNDGTEWTTKMSNTSLIYVGSASNVFNGNAQPWNTSNYASFNQGTLTLLTGVNIEVKHSIRIFGNWGYGDYIVINGVNYLNDGDGSNKWITPTGVTYPLTLSSLALDTTPLGYQNSLSAIEIDGVIMKDNTTQNLAFGTNGFYFPMDGNSSIGQDQSGNGNDWTPVNFGGSAALDKATGALPILNTGNGGTVATPGVFGSQVGRDYTILGTSGGGLYRFDGITETNPPLSFVRGATYIFDYSATSGAHPLAFSTTDPDSSTTSYTNGVDTATSNVTKITVPHDAPDTLYYYCTSHSNMNNAITVTTDESKADPYASKCVLAMPLTSNGADSSGQINCTTSTKAITTGGSPATDNNSNFYRSAIDFTASNTTGYYPTGAQSDFTFGQGDFTVEFWFKPTSTSRQYMTDFRNNGSGSGSGNNKPFVIFADNGSDGTGTQIRYANDTSSPNFDLLGGTGLPTSNTWHHLAIVRSSGTVYGYLDGALTNSATDNTNYSTNDSVTIGNSSGVSLNFDGSIQDYRIYKGLAKYTSNFVPASINPDIIPDTPSGVAFKSQLSDSEKGSVGFDGGSDCIIVRDHADLRFGTNPFTIECWVYFESITTSTYPSIFSKYTGGTASWIMRVKNDGKAVFYTAHNGGTNNESSTTPITTKKWHHIAMVREGTGTNQAKMYVDGKLVVTCTDGTDYTDTQDVVIGAQSASNSNPLRGFMSNCRIVNGTAVYTDEFTPSSEPLTNVTNTKLLCCQSSRSAADFTVCPDNLTGSINDGTIWGENFRVNNSDNHVQNTGGAFTGTADGSNFTTLSLQSGNTRGLVWSAPSPITVSTGLRIYWRNWTQPQYNDGYVFVNGVQKVTAPSNVNTWIDLSFTGTLYELELRSVYNSGSGHHIDLVAIEVDGVILQQNLVPMADAEASGFSPFNGIDAARGQEGTYAVMNPLGKGSNVTLSRNNLRAVSGGSGNSNRSGFCNMAVPASGSYYCEATIGATNGMVGIINADYFKLDNIPGCTPNSYAYYENGNKYLGDCNALPYGDTFTTGDVIGMGIDRGTLTFYKNGRSQGPAIKDLTGRYFFGFGSYNNTIDFNFGQKPFKFGPPRGHQPVTSTTIRETSLEPRPNKYCAPVIWTGSSLNVSESRTITTDQADFIPDLVWVKTRTGGNEPPAVYDSVRGDGTGNKRLLADRANAESTFSSGVSADLSGFVKGGFTVNGTNGHINGGTNYTHAAWMWKAGGKHNTFNIDDVGYANASDVNMSVGSLNSTMLRQDANYANSSNFSGDTSGLTFTRMFNGTMGSGDVDATVCLFSPYGNGLETTWTAPTVITNITKLRIYVDMSGTTSGGAFEVNGKDYRHLLDSAIYGQITSGEDGWVTIPETYLSKIKFGRNSNNNIAIGICAVEVNDQILIDNQITAPNFPSIANDGCSVGTKNGFSIVTFTGNGSAAQLAHGLGDYPDFILHKFRTDSSNWSAWSPFFNNNTRVIFNDNDGMASSSSFNQNTKHTFNVHSGHNDNNVQMIAYCWKNIPGVQKFGQYTGTGSDLGAYIDCGFKPAIVITKAYSTNSTNNNDWIVKDTARDPYNSTTKNLLMNRPDQELSNASHTTIDITENGFKLYNDDSGYSNYSGGAGTWDYIYLAFAEQPAFNLYGALSNTR